MNRNTKDHRVVTKSFVVHRTDPPDEKQILSDASIGTEVLKNPKTSRPQFPEDLPVAIRSKRASDDSPVVTSESPTPVPSPITSRSLHVAARSKKATDDEYSQAVHRVQQLARVTNSIYLHQEIAKGKIQSDVLISELLRIGTVSSSDISSIDPKTINEIVEDVDKLATSLTSDNDIQRIEERLMLYDKMLKKTELFVENPKVTGKDKFIEEVRALKSKNVDVSYIETYSEAFHTVLDQLTQMRSQPLSSAKGLFLTISSRLSNISHSNISGLEASLKFDQLRKGREIFKPLSAIRHSIDEFVKDPNVTTIQPTKDGKPIQDTQSNMNKLNTVATKVNTSKAMIDNVCRMFLTRTHPSGNMNLLYTHGFLDGYSDLQDVFNDLQDDWMNTAVHEQSVQLAKGLNSLKNLHEKSKAVADHLLIKEPDFKVLSSRCDQLAELADLANDIAPLSTQLEKLKIDATPSSVLPSNDASFGTLLQDIQSLSDKLNAVDDIIHLANELNDGKSIKSLTEIVNNASKDVKGSYDKIMNDPEMKTLYEKLLKRKESLEILKTGNVLEALPKVDSNFKEVDTYISGLSTYNTHLQKLRVLPGSKFIEKVIGGIGKIRGVKPPGSISKTINVVEEIKPKVVELKKAVDEMKVDNTPEAKALVAPNLLEVSKTIGSAVQGINSMKKLAAIPQDHHQKLKNGCQLVNKQLENVFMNSDDSKNLQLIIDLPSKLDTISTGISSMKTSTTVSLENNIPAQAAVFQSAASVQGLQYDFVQIAGSVEELIKSLPNGPELDSIKEMIPLLEELDSIGLDFSRHHSAFQNSESKLKELDLFFANFKNELTKNPPAKPLPTVLSSTPSSQGELESTNAPSGGNVFTDHPLLFGIGGGGLAIVGGIVVVVLGVVYCKKKKPKVVEEIKEPLILPERELQETQPLSPPIVIAVTAEMLNRFITGIYDDVENDNNNRMKNKSDTFTKMFRQFLKGRYLVYSRPKTETWTESIRGWSDYFLGEIPLSKHDRISVTNTRKHFKEGTELRLHGNMITFKDETKVAVMQAPVNPRFFKLKKSNVEQWWYKAMEMETKVIICLTRHFEMWSGGQQCAEYYPAKKGGTVEFDRLKIHCESLTFEHEGEVQIRKLRVEFEGHPPFFIEKHIVYVNWPKGSCPGKDTIVFELLDELAEAWNKYQKPVIVHSSNSTGRAACLVLCKLLREDMDLATGIVPYEPIFQKLRQWRANGVENEHQYFFCITIFYRRLLREREGGELSAAAIKANNTINAAMTAFLEEFDKINKAYVTKTADTADGIRSISDDVFHARQNFNKNAQKAQQKRAN